MTKQKSWVDKTKVQEVADGLLKYVKHKEKKDLGTAIEAVPICLQICFKKIPHVQNKFIKIKLPVSLLTDTTDICLFVKDQDKLDRDYEVTVRHFKELLESKGVSNIAEIVPLKQLKLEYKPYEAKRNLSNMYDVYLADDRIFRLLPKYLGKHFLGRKRYPQQVNLTRENLKKEIQEVLCQTNLVISGKGSSCMVSVAHSDMSTEQICANVQKVLESLQASLPGGPKNVRSLVLKTADSPGLPIYVSLGKRDEVVLDKKQVKPEQVFEDEVTTVTEGRVRITASGRVHVVANSKGQHKSSVAHKKKAESSIDQKNKTGASQTRKRTLPEDGDKSDTVSMQKKKLRKVATPKTDKGTSGIKQETTSSVGRKKRTAKM